MENLISLQSEGLRSIGEPTFPRPSGVQQDSVLVVVDVSKAMATAAVYWALGNVVRKGDHLKILGIVTHVSNPLGFMVRVDQSTRSNPDILELQFEIATKKEAIWRTAYLKDWCERAEVKLEVDVKAGNNSKLIASDEAKSMGAFHVILDKTMKKDRKYFVDNLSCFVSRVRSNGGVDTIRSFTMSNKLPPMAPVTPRKSAPSNCSNNSNNSNQPVVESGRLSRASLASTSSSSSYHGSSMSSTSFELGGEACDDFSAHDGDIVCAMQGNMQGGAPGDAREQPPPQLTIRINTLLPNQLFNLLRTESNNMSTSTTSNSSTRASNRNSVNSSNGYCNSNYNGNSGLNWNANSSSKSLNWNCNSSNKSIGMTCPPTLPVSEPSAPGAEFRFERGLCRDHKSSSFASFKFNVAPELMKGQLSMALGRSPISSLQPPASFNQHSVVLRVEKINMDLHWPLMHWADARAFKLRSKRNGSSSLASWTSNSSSSNLRGRRRSVVSGLNYSDMVDSD